MPLNFILFVNFIWFVVAATAAINIVPKQTMVKERSVRGRKREKKEIKNGFPVLVLWSSWIERPFKLG